MGSPALDPALQQCLPSAEPRGRISSLTLLAALCLMQPGMLLATFAARSHCWLSSAAPPGLPGPLQSCFAVGWHPACMAQNYSSPGTGLCISLCQTSWDLSTNFSRPFPYFLSARAHIFRSLPFAAKLCVEALLVALNIPQHFPLQAGFYLPMAVFVH